MAQTRLRKRSVVVVVLGVAAIVLLLMYSDDLSRVAVLDTGGDEANPSVAAMRASLLDTPDRGGALLEHWESRSMARRAFAIAWVREQSQELVSDWSRLRPAVVEATASADGDVAIDALSALTRMRDGGAGAYAHRGLDDADPRIRIAWVRYLAATGDASQSRLLAPLLGDVNDEVAMAALGVLQQWTGRTIALADGASRAERRREAETFAAWLDSQKDRYPVKAPPVAPPPAMLPAAPPPAVEVLRLDGVNDRSVSVPARPGMTTVLHFFATRCEGCDRMAGPLGQLERNFPGRVRVVHVNLDMVAEARRLDPSLPESVSVDLAELAPGLEQLSRVEPLSRDAAMDRSEQLANRLGPDAAIAIDEAGETSSRFRGLVLPTVVWIDGAGLVRRRFSGERDAVTLERMLLQIDPGAKDARRPAPADSLDPSDPGDLLKPRDDGP